MMNRRTIGWIVAIALGASGTALADNSRETGGQSQQRTTVQKQQSQQQSQQQTPQQERTYEERTLDQQTRETTVGAPRRPEPEVADVSPTAGEDVGFMLEEKRAASMTLEDRVEAIRLKALENDEAVEVQTKLQDLGYYKGAIDGIIGPQTRASLQRYFRDQAALASRGLVGSAALMSLGIDESVIQRVRGMDE